MALRYTQNEGTVYLFGAGASAQYLPVALQMREDIERTVHKLVSLKSKQKNLIVGDKPLFEYFDFAENHLKFLLNESRRFPTIDSFAKALTIQKDFNKLRILKFSLSLYFCLKQNNVNVDKRYLHFLSMVVNDFKLDNRYKLFSWNYDFQMELSLSILYNLRVFHQCKSVLNVLTCKENINDLSKSFYFKLNGTAGFYDNFGTNDHYISRDLNDSLDTSISELLIMYYNSYLNLDYESSLNFAWENSIKTDILNNISYSVQNAKNLVIIGYSFPAYNRTIDKELLKMISPTTKTFIQCKDANDEIEIELKRDFNLKDITKIQQSHTFFNPEI